MSASTGFDHACRDDRRSTNRRRAPDCVRHAAGHLRDGDGELATRVSAMGSFIYGKGNDLPNGGIFKVLPDFCLALHASMPSFWIGRAFRPSSARRPRTRSTCAGPGLRRCRDLTRPEAGVMDPTRRTSAVRSSRTAPRPGSTGMAGASCAEGSFRTTSRLCPRRALQCAPALASLDGSSPTSGTSRNPSTMPSTPSIAAVAAQFRKPWPPDTDLATPLIVS